MNNIDKNILMMHAPYLSWNEDESLCRFNVKIEEEGEPYLIFAEVEK